MGENVSERGTAFYQNHIVTPETLDLFQRSREAYGESRFDDIGESEKARAAGVRVDLRCRIDTFLKGTKDGGILLGPVVEKLKENLDEISYGKAPTAPQAEGPGGGFVKAGGYPGWFGSLGWYPPRAKNLDKKVAGKYEHALNLEKLPESSELEKLSEEKFTERYGKSKEKYLQDGGALFDEKEGGDKLWFLQNHVIKRLTWEKDMVLKDTVDYIRGRSNKPKTALGIASHVSGIACGDRVDSSILAGREEYWQQVDEKLKDARFKTDEEFKETWKVSKKAFIIKEVVPELHALYTKVIKQKVARMDVEELKDRFYLSKLRGDELLGELLGGTHSAAKDVAYLEARQKRLNDLMGGLSVACDGAEVKFAENEKARSARLPELKENMLELERRHPEIAYAAKGIVREMSDAASDGTYFAKAEINAKKAEIKAEPGTSILKRQKYNPYLMLLADREEFVEDKEQLEKSLSRLEVLKHSIGKSDLSALEHGLWELDAKTREVAFSDSYVSKPLSDREIAEKLLDMAEYRRLEERKKELTEVRISRKEVDGAPECEVHASLAESGSKERAELSEIEAAEEKWKENAGTAISKYLKEKQRKASSFSYEIRALENAIETFEEAHGIARYKRLEERKKYIEEAVRDMSLIEDSEHIKVVVQKLAFDALEKAEGELGQTECYRLEDRLRELKSNPPKDPVFREAASKEIEFIEERLGIGAYKKLEARIKDIKYEKNKRLATETSRVRLDKFEVGTQEYEELVTYVKELEENIEKEAREKTEKIKGELGITGYTDIGAEGKKLQERIDELKKIQKIPGEIEAKRKEIADKEDNLESLKTELGEIENKFGIAGYAGSDLTGRIKYLKENLPRDPSLRKLALNGMKSPTGIKGKDEGVNLTGLEVVENKFELAQYDKTRLEKEIKELEGKLPQDLQLELKEIERLENTKEELRLALTCEAKNEYNAQVLKEIERLENAEEELKLDGEKWLATHGVAAFDKWKEEHGVSAYKKLVEAEKAIEAERTNESWARKDAHDALVEFGKNIDSVEQGLTYLTTRLEDKRQPDELRDALWGRGKYSPRRLFSYGAIAKNDTSEFEQLLKKEFGLELAGDVKVEKDKESNGLNVLSENSPHVFLQLYNQNRGVRLEIEDGKRTIVKRFLSRTDKKTGELVVEDYPVSMKLFNRLYGEVKARLPEELRKKARTAIKNIKKRNEWLSSHPSSDDWDEVHKKRAALEFKVLKPGRLFSYDAIEQYGDTSEFSQYLKQKFGVELAEGATVTKGPDGTLNISSENLPPISLFTYMDRHGVLLQIGDGNKENALRVLKHELIHLVHLQIGDGNKENALGQVHRESGGQDTVIEKLMARTDPKTKELVVFPDEKRDVLAKRVHAAYEAKVEGKKK